MLHHCFLCCTDRTLTADKRKGKIVLCMEEGILRFQWLVRPSDDVDFSLMIFEGQAVWEKVPQCTDGRVYVLKFKDSNVKRFFWMQEPKDEKDEEYAKKINELISKPPASV